MTIQNIQEFLKATEFFSRFSYDDFCEITKNLRVKKIPKGQNIYNESQKAENFYIVKHGLIKLFKQTIDGEESVIDLLSVGKIFGEYTVFNNNTYSNSACVLEDSEIIIIRNEVLKHQIELNPKISFLLLEFLSTYRLKLELEKEHVYLQNAPQRIGCFILGLYKKDCKDNTIIRLPYDKYLISSKLGMKPETFSRALKILTDNHGIKVNGSELEIKNIEELTRFSCSSCSSTFPCKH